MADPEKVADNLKAYINGLSKNTRDVFIEHFGFFNWIDRLERQNLLYAMVKFFADKDLHPERVSTVEMSYIFENLIRRFNEASNATVGDHYTPREVIRLMTSLLFAKDGDQLASEASAINILDPARGTGGMLATANDYLMERNANLRVNLFGQEVNPESFAICHSDMLLTRHSLDNIELGNTLNDDQFPVDTFTYCISNPPYGVDYSEEYEDVLAEHEDGEHGRFAPGIPRKSDGQLLFLLHMISKLPKDRPRRILAGGTGNSTKPGELLAPLSKIIREFNERYGLSFKEKDLRWMEGVGAQTEADEVLVQQAKNGDPSAFKTVYDEKALDLLIDQRERSKELFNTLVGNDAAREFLFDKMREAFLRRLSATTQISTNYAFLS